MHESASVERPAYGTAGAAFVLRLLSLLRLPHFDDLVEFFVAATINKSAAVGVG